MSVKVLTKKAPAELKDLYAPVLREYLEDNIKELEKKLRFSQEETKIYQGALRALDDILEVIK